MALGIIRSPHTPGELYIHRYVRLTIYIYISVYTYICIYIYMHVDIHTHIYIYIHAYIYVHIYIYVYTYMCIYRGYRGIMVLTCAGFRRKMRALIRECKPFFDFGIDWEPQTGNHKNIVGIQ